MSPRDILRWPVLHVVSVVSVVSVVVKKKRQILLQTECHRQAKPVYIYKLTGWQAISFEAYGLSTRHAFSTIIDAARAGGRSLS